MSRRAMGNEKDTDPKNGGDASAPGAGYMVGPNYKTPAAITAAVNPLLPLSMWHELCLRVMKRKLQKKAGQSGRVHVHSRNFLWQGTGTNQA